MTIGAQFIEKNFNVKEIAELSGDSLLVRHIWYSIQGEGIFAGQPAVFVRLGGCNRGAKLDCIYCDTDFRVDKSSLYTIPALLKQVELFTSPKWRNPLVVITGGEPFMHRNVAEFSHALIEQGYRVQFETNGDFVRIGSAPGATIIVSPKISGHTGKYAVPNAEMLMRADYLKIVVSADPNNPYNQLPDFLDRYLELKGRDHVFISPINEYNRPYQEGEVASIWSDLYDHVECARNHQYAARVVQENCFRLSLQTHVFVAAP